MSLLVVFVVGVLTLPWSSAQIDGSCEECINFIQLSTQLFASDQVVDLTEKFLKEEVCKPPHFEDVQGCRQGIDFWYKPMVKAGLTGDDFGMRFCYHYGICRQQHKVSHKYRDFSQTSLKSSK